MGTLVLDNVRSRKEMVEYLTTRDTSDGYEILDHSAKGNILYTLERHPEGYRFIGVYKMSGPTARERSQGECGWGYKAMDESVGPSFYDCPERILRQSDVEDRHGWREKCRKARRKKAAIKEWSKCLKSGLPLELHRGWRRNEETNRQEKIYEEVIFDYNWSGTYFVGHRPSEGSQYRFRWDDVRIPEEVEQAA